MRAGNATVLVAVLSSVSDAPTTPKISLGALLLSGNDCFVPVLLVSTGVAPNLSSFSSPSSYPCSRRVNRLPLFFFFFFFQGTIDLWSCRHEYSNCATKAKQSEGKA